MRTSPVTLNDLPPELFPIIASHLPLYATPSTILSLALVNHHIAEIVLPLVCSHLILKNEDDALKIFLKLLAEPKLGLAVRELHILCNLSIETCNGENPFDVVTGLTRVVKAGSLPYIHTLGLQLLNGWHFDRHFKSVDGYGQLRPDFWVNLRLKCPRLKGIILRNVRDTERDRWFDNSGLYDVQGISNFTLALSRGSGTDVGFEKLLKNINKLSPFLHTLSLSQTNDWYPASPIFSIKFPSLRSLTLNSYVIVDVSETMAFWNSHPSLEYIELARNPQHNGWFAGEISADFLPNLHHLKARIPDQIRTWELNIVSRQIIIIINAQIPFLVRSVLPDGLPNLKSLYLGQRGNTSERNYKIEGALWYETEEGHFKENNNKKARVNIFGNYMHSIVRGVPNLEELELPGYMYKPLHFEIIASKLAPFSRLERLYCQSFHRNIEDDLKTIEWDIFVGGCRTLAKACKSLRQVTNIETTNFPYLMVSIRRTEVGEVDDLIIGKGYEMQIGNEDEAFPNLLLDE